MHGYWFEWLIWAYKWVRNEEKLSENWEVVHGFGGRGITCAEKTKNEEEEA